MELNNKEKEYFKDIDNPILLEKPKFWIDYNPFRKTLKVSLETMEIELFKLDTTYQ